MDTFPLCCKHALLPLSRSDNASSPTTARSLRLIRRHLEATYDFMLFGSKEHVQTSGSGPQNIRIAGLAVHAERYQLHCIRCPNLHDAPLGELAQNRSLTFSDRTRSPSLALILN